MYSVENGGILRLREATFGNIKDARNLEANLGLLSKVYESEFCNVEKEKFFDKDFMQKNNKKLKAYTVLVQNIFDIANKYYIYLDRPNESFCCFLCGMKSAYNI